MRKKPIIISAIILLLVVGAGGAYFYMDHKKEVAKEEFWNKQKPRIEMYLRYNYKNIETIHYTKTSENPMGVSIVGYVNKDPKLEFIASVTGYESEFNTHIMTSEGLEELAVLAHTSKSVDEIEKEKMKDQ